MGETSSFATKTILLQVEHTKNFIRSKSLASDLLTNELRR